MYISTDILGFGEDLWRLAACVAFHLPNDTNHHEPHWGNKGMFDVEIVLESSRFKFFSH